MKIEIIAPCFYPDEYFVRYFLKSAARYGITPSIYGLQQPFRGWIDTHITACLEHLKQIRSTHVLFTDASDVIFLQGIDEIHRRYVRLGYPKMLVSCEETGLNAGGWIGEVEVAIQILEYLATQDYSDNPQERWRWAASRHQVSAEYDLGRTIFQVVEGRELKDTCILHFAGGYTDPAVGKQAQIEPLFRGLGYEL